MKTESRGEGMAHPEAHRPHRVVLPERKLINCSKNVVSQRAGGALPPTPGLRVGHNNGSRASQAYPGGCDGTNWRRAECDPVRGDGVCRVGVAHASPAVAADSSTSSITTST